MSAVIWTIAIIGFVIMANITWWHHRKEIASDGDLIALSLIGGLLWPLCVLCVVV